MKLYIWDNAIFVVAASVEAARALAAERLGDLDSVKEIVRQARPTELDVPCVHLIFHTGVTS